MFFLFQVLDDLVGEEAKLMKVMNILNRKLNHFILLIGRFLTVLEALCFFLTG